MNQPSQDAERLEPVPTLVGRRIGKYEILGLVGRGGMGAVYEALNTTIGKRVAMKCIDASLAANPEANARFQREALAASAIESPYIVQIFDAGATDDGMPYIVMELLRGRDLGRCLAEVGRLEVVDALLIVAQVLRGLRHAHAAGIVHRDLKPDNVFLVDRDDEPYRIKILDFGVSKIGGARGVPLETLTQQGSVVGTPYYMAPEQAQAFPDVDARADLYSVGAILYECLAGRPPHIGQAYEQVIVNICMKDAEDIRQYNPAVSEPLAQVVGTALRRERADRYGSARQMLDALIEHAPPELRADFRSAPSGMRRLGLGASAGGEPVSSGKLLAAVPATGEDAAGAPGPLAATVRAESGMMSVATRPSDPPELPMETLGRRWLLPVIGALGLLFGGGAVLLSSFGDTSTKADTATEPAVQRSAVASAGAGRRGAAPTGPEPAKSARAHAPPSAAPRPSAAPTVQGDAGAGRSRSVRSSSPHEPAVATVGRPSEPPPTLPSVVGETSQPSGLPLLKD